MTVLGEMVRESCHIELVTAIRDGVLGLAAIIAVVLAVYWFLKTP